MYAFTSEGTPLGSVWNNLLVRAPRPRHPAMKKSRPPPEMGMAGGEGRRHLRIVAGFPMLGEVEALIFLVTVYSQADRCVDDFQQDDTYHAGQQDGID